jgi:butyrate kinase
MAYKILSINPGATSTKVSLSEDKNPLVIEVLRHSTEELKVFPRTQDQLDYRKNLVTKFLQRNNFKIADLAAVVGRGGPFKPLSSGTYRVNQKMLSDIKSGNVLADHVSNLGALIAYELTKDTQVPAFIVDPVSVDELIPVARISGMPELERISLSHALNIKMVARKAASELGRKYEELNLVIVHLGSGISVTSHLKGQMIDVSNANDGGPLAPQRTGGLPATGLAKLCLSGKYAYAEMYDRITKKGGLLAYLGTDNVEEIEKRADSGDEKARLIYEAMVYQIAKEIGAMAATLYGKVDAIVLTGGIARSERLINMTKERVSFLSKILVFPGEDELEALTLGALRVLTGEEKEKGY